MITAKEAFQQTLQNTENVETIDYLLELETQIKDAASKGWYCVNSKPMLAPVAEKLGIELEEFGYFPRVMNSGVVNEKNEPLCCISVTWRYKPGDSWIDKNIPCN